MIKKILILLAMVMTVFIRTDAVCAEDEYTEGELIYIIENESITITGCFGRNAEVEVPAMIAGMPVSTIAENAFTSPNIKEIHLPETVMTVREGAISPGIKVVFESERMAEQNTEIQTPENTDTSDINEETILVDTGEEITSDEDERSSGNATETADGPEKEEDMEEQSNEHRAANKEEVRNKNLKYNQIGLLLAVILVTVLFVINKEKRKKK